MSTIEDKILDGPTIHYCDAGDDDIRTGPDAGIDNNDPDSNADRRDVSSMFVRPDQDTTSTRLANGVSGSGYSSNTGPKGVLEDFRKQSAPRVTRNVDEQDLDDEFNQLMNDDTIIKTFVEKMVNQRSLLPSFGAVIRLNNGPELLEAIDREHNEVTVLVHIYTRYSRSCKQVDKCLDELANELNHMKIVTIDASVTGLSDNFKQNGVPALLAYKGGSFLKSIVKIEDLLDKDFETRQLKDLLIDHGLLL